MALSFRVTWEFVNLKIDKNNDNAENQQNTRNTQGLRDTFRATGTQ